MTNPLPATWEVALCVRGGLGNNQKNVATLPLSSTIQMPNGC